MIVAGCSKCKEGYIYTPKTVGIGYTYEYCDCFVEAQSLKVSRRLLKESNIPTGLIKLYNLVEWEESSDITFKDLVDIIDKAGIEENWLFLHGKAGTGKTYITIILAMIAILREKSVYFSDIVSLLDDLRPGNPDAGWILKQCEKVDVLILDDIGHEKSSQWVRERLYLIINRRWNSRKVTLFTSNFSIENLKKTVSEAVYSRVKGECWEVQLDSAIDRRINK